MVSKRLTSACIGVTAIFILLCVSVSGVFAAIEATVSVEKSYLSENEVGQKVYISATSTENRIVDVYLGLVSPNGDIHTMPSLSVALNPWLTGISIPAGYSFPVTEIFDASAVPGGLIPGLWQAAIALADAGTNNFFLVELAPFQVVGTAAVNDGISYGVLSLSRMESQDGSVKTDGEALFASYAGTLDDFDGMYEGYTDQLELDQCVLSEYSYDDFDDIPTVQFVSLDAGQPLTLSLEGRTANLERQENYGTIAYSADLDNAFYQTGQAMFQGAGGSQIGSFSTSLNVPDSISLSAPLNMASHDATSNLDVRWSGGNGTGKVSATLSGGTMTGSVDIECRFADDGHGVIPGELIRQMKSKLETEGSSGFDIPGLGDIPNFGDLPLFGSSSVTLDVERSIYSVFNTQNNELDVGVVSIQTGVERTLTLE